MQSEEELVSAVREEAAEVDQAGESGAAKSVGLTARDLRPDKKRSVHRTLPSRAGPSVADRHAAVLHWPRRGARVERLQNPCRGAPK